MDKRADLGHLTEILCGGGCPSEICVLEFQVWHQLKLQDGDNGMIIVTYQILFFIGAAPHINRCETLQINLGTRK